MANLPLNLEQVYQTRQRISPYCLRANTVSSSRLSLIIGDTIFLKLECLQNIGSFKIRGAASKITKLTSAEKQRGVITASTGNHARAVSYVAKYNGIPVSICISEDVPKNKVEAIRSLGAEVIIFGHSQDEAFAKVTELQERDGKILVHPFDDIHVISGQATIGLELIEDIPNLDRVIVPLSGGGLISGIGFVMKTINPSIEVLGVSMDSAPAMFHCLRSGKPIQIPEEDTLADSLRGGIGLDNRFTFQMVQNFVDDIILVSEEEIATAMAYLFKEHRLVVEGAGAVGVAALLSRKVLPKGKNTAVIISGNNIDVSFFLEAVQPYLNNII
jgi:threonine dehydratase